MKTVFIRAIEAPVDEKRRVVLSAVRRRRGERFECEIAVFSRVPGSPFAYWANPALVSAYQDQPPFESSGRTARLGGGTKNDGRYLRVSWEVAISARSEEQWVPFAKGGAFAPYYSDVHLVANWGSNAREIEAELRLKYPYLGENVDFVLHRELRYGRPGITWSRRTTSGLSARVLPQGCVFSDKGPSAFVEGDGSEPLLATLALMRSTPFEQALSLQLAAADKAARSYEVGIIQRTPIPEVHAEDMAALAELARRAWRRMRQGDSHAETSHAFLLPALLQVGGDALTGRAQSWAQLTARGEAELDALAVEIDEHAFRLYSISAEDRQRIEQGFGTSSKPDAARQDDDDGDESDGDGDAAEVDATPMVASLLSWMLGVAFGRFDVRLATGEHEAPPEPEPFDPLPVCSPGMLTGDDGLPLAAPPAGYPLTFPTDGILVDDPGHTRDIVRAVRSVFETVFDDANTRWHEAAELLGAPDLRSWFARDFFEPHIKRYSKSRRKAPIYWQLGTASGSYSVWIYIHRATGDTLFRVLNDFIGPKLDHEKAKLDGLSQEAGSNPSAAQRREIEQQESFVGELQALKTEVARVAPLWKPNLDDGVILNFAPLWRVVPQSRSWQGECKKAWDKLVARDYDWAHMAMHLWPEQVVPKCIDDRSLAIAHGLEDVFWHEDDSGTWRKSRVDDATVQKLLHERTSTTVKAALKDLLSAATPTASKGRKAKGRSASPRSAVPKPSPAAVRTAAPETAVDDATLRAVKAAIASFADGASKADVLSTTGLSDGDWNKAIAALLDRGDVTRTGQKRGTRYHEKKS